MIKKVVIRIFRPESAHNSEYSGLNQHTLQLNYMEGCVPMYPNESHSNKSTKHNAALPKPKPAADTNETNDPPGVHMPPETEMSPPQFG